LIVILEGVSIGLGARWAGRLCWQRGGGNAGTVELAPTAGRTVFDIRAGIIADQAALRVLQRYVGEFCSRGSPQKE